jgi:exonuclease III
MIGKFQTFQNHLPNQLTQKQDIITLQESRVSRMGWELMRESKGFKSVSKSPCKSLGS